MQTRCIVVPWASYSLEARLGFARESTVKDQGVLHMSCVKSKIEGTKSSLI